ncbi:ORF6N domain-containing protein [Flagellimonas flava]|uniref:ORF6N domain-containing protein n=1 Tax=Flagellimonas flava TaxID=570519 RepID=UPI003D65C999
MELQTIQNRIYEVRGQKVLLDFDLAAMYETETKKLKQAVRRNIERFPSDFMFELTNGEYKSLRSQFVTLEKDGRGKFSKYNPFAFTEQGIAMLASVLRSPKAIEVNIQIVRAFVFLRKYALSHSELTQKLQELETKYDRQFKDVFEAINFLLQKDKIETDHKKRNRIGFKK